MKRIQRLVVTASMTFALAACTAAQTTAPPINSANVVQNSKLQFAVGTANIYGIATALNVVSTLRQPNGTSATGVNTPTITGPFANTNAAVETLGPSGFLDPYTTIYNFGPSLRETTASAPLISGTSQGVHPGTPFCDAASAPSGFTSCPTGIPPNTTSFGQSGGVFAMGIAPYNIVANLGQSYSYQPYPEPIYDAGGAVAPEAPLFAPWGGPPAFDPDGNGMGTRDGLVILGGDNFGFPYFLGVGEGITVFRGVTPAVGQYSLAVQIGIIGNNGTPQIITLTSSARLGALTVLPTLTAPTVTPDANLDGGATFSASLPAPVTEALVQIVDWGPGGGPLAGGGSTSANCQGAKGPSFAPVYYTIVVRGSGTFTLGANHGPNNLAGGAGSLTPTQSICTAQQNSTVVGTAAGDNFTVQMIGFDYPAYEAAFSLTQATVPQTPTITGAGGQSDITISLPIEEDWTSGGYTVTTLRSGRMPLRRSHAAHFGAAYRVTPEVYRKLGVPAPR